MNQDMKMEMQEKYYRIIRYIYLAKPFRFSFSFFFFLQKFYLHILSSVKLRLQKKQQTLTSSVKKTLSTGLSCFEWTHESQLRFTVPSGKPSITISFKRTSLSFLFSTITAPTFPKSAGNSKVASYFTSFSFSTALRASTFVVLFSDCVSGIISRKNNGISGDFIGVYFHILTLFMTNSSQLI